MSFFEFAAENYMRILSLSWDHIRLSLVTLGIASALGVSLGLVVSRLPFLAAPLLWVAGIIYTIPSLALFGVMIPFLGIGTLPAIVALVAYVQLVIIRNTYVGMTALDPAIIEAARGMGMTEWQLLRWVQLPLALPVIVAGIRMSAVLIVSLATIAAWIGAGGLGTFIVRGLASINTNLIFAGAIPAILLAIGFDQILGQIERVITSPGVRVLKETTDVEARRGAQTVIMTDRA